MKINQNDRKINILNYVYYNQKRLKVYNCTNDEFNKLVISDIIYDEPKRLVSVFKEFLLWDECSDFLRRYDYILSRFYNLIESSTRIPGIAEYYNKFTVIPPNYAILTDVKKHLLKNIKKKAKVKEKYYENEEEKIDNSHEKYSTVLKSIDMESIESLHERTYELTLISNEFMDNNNNVSIIETDETIDNFSISINTLKSIKKRGESNLINNVVQNDFSKIKNKSNKKKQNNVKYEPKKNHPNKQLISSQKSYKNIIHNYLKKDLKSSNQISKPIFHKIQPAKVNVKESYQNYNREKNRNSQHKFEDSKNKTPLLSSQTPQSFKTNLRSAIQTNLTSRNSIISPTTFLKVNLTKENVLEKSGKRMCIPINQIKGKTENPHQSNLDYNSNKELISSSIFKTIISNLVTPNKKLGSKGSKAPITGKVNLTKKEEPNYIKKPKINILGGLTGTNNTTSFNNSKASSVYNINLNLNLNVNFNNSSKGSSSNTTLKNNNLLNSNNSTSKPRLNELNSVVNLKENKINIHESNVIKKINSPRKEELNINSDSSKIETNELPLSDRIKLPKDNLLKQSSDKNTKTIEQSNFNSKDSKGKNGINYKSKFAEKKSNVGFVNKIVKLKNNPLSQKAQNIQNFVKSVTPVCTNNSLNKLLKLNLDLKILENRNINDKKKIETKISKEEEKNPKLLKKIKNAESHAQGIQIKNFDKIFDVKKYISNNTTKTNKQITDIRKKPH